MLGFVLTFGFLCIRMESNRILADIISDRWPESLYRDAFQSRLLVMDLPAVFGAFP